MTTAIDRTAHGAASLLLFLLAACSGSGGSQEAEVEPEAWTAESRADSGSKSVETVDLVYCPDGLVPWSADQCAPRIGQCDNPWELPLIGGQCMAVGPRGCEKTWHPDSDADCQAGELMPCPDGLLEAEDGTHCIPRFDDSCGDLEIPVLGGGCAGPIGAATDCPDGPFPEAPTEAQFVLYANSDSTCTEGCGSYSSPFPSIQAAVEAAPPGACVLVGAGTFDEGIVIDKSVQVVGLCAAKTVLTGSVAVASEQTALQTAAVLVTDSAFAELRDISITSAGPGVVVLHKAKLAAEGLKLSACEGAALFVGGESTLTIADSLVIETAAAADSWGEGVGLWVNNGSSAKVTRVVMEASTGAGVVATGQGTAVVLEDCLVRGTRPGDEWSGCGIRVDQDGSADLESTVLEENSGSGLVADSGAAVWVNQSVIRDNLPDADLLVGGGFDARGGSSIIATDCLVSGNRVSGVRAQDQLTSLTIERCVIEEKSPADEEKKGPTELVVAGCIIAQTRPNNQGAQGQAMVLGSNTVAQISTSLIRDNNTTGVLISSRSDTAVLLNDCAVLHSMAGGAWLEEPETGESRKEFQVFGDGVAIVGEGAAVDISDLLVMDNARCGVYYCEAAGTVSGSVITGNLSFGLAMEDSAQHVDFETTANHVFANALDLPPALAAQITTNPTGLPVPAPPEPMGQMN